MYDTTIYFLKFRSSDASRQSGTKYKFEIIIKIVLSVF
jgi:hypothetical protein